MARHPEILWAQRSDKVYVTVELLDAKSPEVKLEPEGRFTFAATVGANNQKFEVDLELFGAIDVEKSTVNKGQRHTVLVLEKKEQGWWSRLLKAEGKAPKFIKVDWNKWVDEDEEDEAPVGSNFDMGGMGGMPDFSSMGGMPDFANMGGDDEDDMDDEDEMPELESTETAAVASEPTKATTTDAAKPDAGAQEAAPAEAAKI